MNRTIYSTMAAAALLTMSGVAHATCAPYGLIAVKYSQLGGSGGALGACLDNEADDGAGGRLEHFQNGQIDWDGHAGAAYGVWGPVAARWQALGGAASWGHPTQDLMNTPNGQGTYGWFRNNTGGVTTIYDKPGSDLCREGVCSAYFVEGAILSDWARLSYERGAFGFPESDEENYTDYWAYPGERISIFDNGFIRWRPDGSMLAKLWNGQCPDMTGSYVTDQANGIDWCPN